MFSPFKKSSIFKARWAGAESCCIVKGEGTPVGNAWAAATDLIQGMRVSLRTSMYPSAPKRKPV